VGAELLYVDGRTDGRADGEHTTVAFRSFAKTSNIQNRIIQTAYNSLYELSCLDRFLSSAIKRLVLS
jgi:hypothetical protein